MIRDITIGQYYPTDSVIHKLDPRVKLVGTIVYIISLFVFRSWVGYVLATLALAAVIKISKVPFKFMIRGLKAIVVLLLITVIFDTGRNVNSNLEAENYERGSRDGCLDDFPPDVFDYWIVCLDIDNDTELSDRWFGKGIESFEKNKGSCS